jgi:hypothetical protein
MRELFAYSYRIIYKVEKDEIVIASVIHGQAKSELIRASSVPSRPSSPRKAYGLLCRSAWPFVMSTGTETCSCTMSHLPPILR